MEDCLQERFPTPESFFPSQGKVKVFLIETFGKHICLCFSYKDIQQRRTTTMCFIKEQVRCLSPRTTETVTMV